MKRQFYFMLAVSGVLTAVLVPLAILFEGGLLTLLATTLGTTFYHFLMRLCVGFAVKETFPKRVDPQNGWFRERAWEKQCYRFLRVRRWAGRVPTFEPEDFELSKHGYKDLARQMCLSELVHELIVIFGFFSLFFCLFFDDPLANLAPFLITAILAGAYDMQFVILQRYNRPKVLRLMARADRRADRDSALCEKNKKEDL